MPEALDPALQPDPDDHPEVPPDSRRGARQVALQALYWAASAAEDPRQAARQLSARCGHSPPSQTFTAALVEAVVVHQAELDALLQACSTRWSLERMARVDLLILRLALAEILYLPDVPLRVSMDEAVELARRYSTAESSAFVNGILDAARQRQGLRP